MTADPAWKENVSRVGEGTGTTLRVSFEGARAADLAAVKITSLMELCQRCDHRCLHSIPGGPQRCQL